MQHFAAYHNTERMGRSLAEADPLRVGTSRRVDHLPGNAVWMIVGEGESPKTFLLGSVFVVNEIAEKEGDHLSGGFRRFARGDGYTFHPHVPLNNLDWFPDFKKSMASFSLGVHRIADEAHIRALQELASSNGYTLP